MIFFFFYRHNFISAGPSHLLRLPIANPSSFCKYSAHLCYIHLGLLVHYQALPRLVPRLSRLGMRLCGDDLECVNEGLGWELEQVEGLTV